MIRRFLYIIFVLFLNVLLSGESAAQDCVPRYQLILEMREARIGSYSVWNTVYGEKDYDERFVAALPVGQEGHHIVAGERRSLNASVRANDIDVLLVRFDYRGRMKWEQVHKIKGLYEIITLMKHSGGYMIVGNKALQRELGSIWIGFFDDEGRFLKSREIKNSKGHISGNDLLKVKDGGGYELVASFEDKLGIIQKHAVLYSIDKNGRVVSDRSYMSGLENGILGLEHAEGIGYIASGYIYDDSGRKTGWALGLDKDGGILWQRQYPRGYGAQIEVAKSYGKDYLVVAGNAEPFGEGQMAGWVMLLNAGDGSVVWQRYYRGENHYYGRDLLVGDDGLISVMLDGKMVSDLKNTDNLEKHSDYVRLLTLNPRGELLFGDAYFNGQGADAYQMLFGSGGQRIMVGSTRISYQIEGVGGAEPVVKTSMDGWVVSAVSAEVYDDPCKAQVR